MKKMNQSKFTSNYIKRKSTKEDIKHKDRVFNIIEMLKFKNITIEMFEFLLENNTFKEQINRFLEMYFDEEIIKGFIINKSDTFFSNDNTMFYFIAEKEKILLCNSIKESFLKASKNDRHIIEDFELMFLY